MISFHLGSIEMASDGKNALRMLLYAILYAAVSAVVCFTGAIHPVLFVCYQITAAILLSGIVIMGFSRIKAPGAAAWFDHGGGHRPDFDHYSRFH